jgi:hypothetical protein
MGFPRPTPVLAPVPPTRPVPQVTLPTNRVMRRPRKEKSRAMWGLLGAWTLILRHLWSNQLSTGSGPVVPRLRRVA